ncbi:MAG: D-alanyl-D-alanine carboxypeptidase family protein [Clostridia bacterium]
MKLNIRNFIFLFFLVITLSFSNFSYIYASDDEPNLNSKAAFLIDNKTNKVLYSKNPDEKMFPASTTKIVTAILVLENCKLNDIVTATAEGLASIPEGYVTANISVDEQLTVEQLLELLLIHSANDAANVLAIHVGGTIANFVNMMNNKVYELNLSNTHFTNTYGLQDNNHYTTAHDLATIMQYCLKNSDFRRIAGSSSCSISETNKSGSRFFSSTNELLVPTSSYYYKYVTSGKTGFTTEAGECLVSSAYNNNLELVCVVLGGSVVDNVSTRFSESKILYEYGFNNFSFKNIANPGDLITQINVANGSYSTANLDLAFTDSINVLVNNNDLNTSYIPTINLNTNISAPISQGDILGTVTYNIDGINYSSNLIATHNVEKSKLLEFICIIIMSFVILLIILIIFFPKKSKNDDINID